MTLRWGRLKMIHSGRHLMITWWPGSQGMHLLCSRTRVKLFIYALGLGWYW